MTSDDQDAIRALAERLRDAEERGDPAPFPAMLASDVVILVPGLGALEGVEPCMDFITTVMNENRAEFSRHTLTHDIAEVRVEGDLAFDRGTFTQVLVSRETEEELRTEGQFLRVFARDGDGPWKLSRVIWSQLGGDETLDVDFLVPDD